MGSLGRSQYVSISQETITWRMLISDHRIDLPSSAPDRKGRRLSSNSLPLELCSTAECTWATPSIHSLPRQGHYLKPSHAPHSLVFYTTLPPRTKITAFLISTSYVNPSNGVPVLSVLGQILSCPATDLHPRPGWEQYIIRTFDILWESEVSTRGRLVISLIRVMNSCSRLFPDTVIACSAPGLGYHRLRASNTYLWRW